MNKIKNENFVAIQGWMVTELKLKGNSLLIYAIIYGFSQTEGQVFSGSLQYLADWTNSTKQGVMGCLKKMVDDGIIGKNEKYVNGVKFVEYYTTKFNGVLNKVGWGIKQSLNNNIEYNIDNISNNNKLLLDKPTATNSKEETYGNKEINEMFDEWEKMFAYRPKDSAQNRRAVYNMLRAKDKGKTWMINTMKILKQAQKDKYAGKNVNGTSNFADLQQNHEHIWKWGSEKILEQKEKQKEQKRISQIHKKLEKENQLPYKERMKRIKAQYEAGIFNET